MLLGLAPGKPGTGSKAACPDRVLARTGEGRTRGALLVLVLRAAVVDACTAAGAGSGTILQNRPVACRAERVQLRVSWHGAGRWHEAACYMLARLWCSGCNAGMPLAMQISMCRLLQPAVNGACACVRGAGTVSPMIARLRHSRAMCCDT